MAGNICLPFYYLYNAQSISITQSDLYENIPQVYPPVSISLYFNATLSCSSNDKTLPQPIPDIEEEEEETKDVVLPEDIQIIPYGGKASEYQPGSDIDKSYDGKFTQGISFESHYHSSWSNTSFPVTLEYFFKGDTEINYFIYYTRSGNGNFGEVEVYTSTDSDRKNIRFKELMTSK